jgi:hypothetical protein
MKRWPSISLALAFSGALAVVYCPRAPEPNESLVPSETKAWMKALPEVVTLRAIAKDQVSREVALGLRSLREAAALFRELNRLPPEPEEPTLWSGADPPPSFPGRTDEERLCRQVVAHVRVTLRHGAPDRAAAVVARLEAEFWEELRQHGAIRLPDPSFLPPVQELLEQARKAMTEAKRQAPHGSLIKAPGSE